MHILTTGKQDYRGSRIKIKFRIFKIDIGSYKTIETARLFLLSENEKSKFFHSKIRFDRLSAIFNNIGCFAIGHFRDGNWGASPRWSSP